ncbi:4309_t:CDS:2, partial [Ambispora leptoticha]
MRDIKVSMEPQERCATKAIKEPIHVVTTSWIFHKLYINCLEPLPRTSGGHEHVVLAVEELTRYGCFAVLVLDRSTEFKNNVLAELAIRLNVDQRFVASYHPEANGRAEQTVQKFTRILRKICAEKQNKWHEYVRSTIWAINITVSDLGYSPFRLVYRRDAGLVVDLKRAQIEKDELKYQWKELHDKKARVKETYQIEDLVLVYNSMLDMSLRKLDYRWMGPYRVRSVGNYGQVYLNELDGPRRREPLGFSSCRIVFEEPLYLVKGMQIDSKMYYESISEKVRREYGSNDSCDHVIDQGRMEDHSVGRH